jgi:hypothetical protein
MLIITIIMILIMIRILSIINIPAASSAATLARRRASALSLLRSCTSDQVKPKQFDQCSSSSASASTTWFDISFSIVNSPQMSIVRLKYTEKS